MHLAASDSQDANALITMNAIHHRLMILSIRIRNYSFEMANLITNNLYGTSACAVQAFTANSDCLCCVSEFVRISEKQFLLLFTNLKSAFQILIQSDLNYFAHWLRGP